MAIGNIADREQGSSVRTKLNLVIDDVNSLAPVSSVARTDVSQTFAADVTVQGAFTSLGIDDNATAERVQVSDTEVTLGAIGANYGIVNAVNDQSTVFSGGNAEGAGANITFYGGTHATLAGDIDIRQDAITELYFDNSASSWDFQANSIITTGALTCGTFTSVGIDDNTTGERLQIGDTALTLGASGANYGVVNVVNNQSIVISGGDTETSGGNVAFFGGAHATKANDVDISGGATIQLAYDDSASSWDFQDNAIITTGALTCGTFTSTGIDDNTTGERFEVTDTQITVGTSGTFYTIARDVADQTLVVTGGSSVTTGGSILLRGETHATEANDIQLRSGSTAELLYDDSASFWDFQMNRVLLDQGTADQGFINFRATIDADATSAISSLTTSGAVTHHIQFQINGTTFWIAGSTTDPS